MSSLERNIREASLSDNNEYHLRSTADRILQGTTKRDIFIDPLSLPIAGLSTISSGSEYPSLTSVPKEILPFSHTPIVLIDLDDTVWPHVPYLIKAIGEASGKPITMDDYLKYGHTRNIPSWTNDEKTMAIHDQIIKGEHPIYCAGVNPAFIDAITSITAIERMGHTFSYVTARPESVFESTKKVIRWNQLPIDKNTHLKDAWSDDIPRSGSLYCIKNSVPGVADKSGITGHWLKNLREKGWWGTMVIIDDLLGSYGSVIQEPDVLGVALNGPLNINKNWLPHEVRVDSWREIGEILKNVHSKAIARNNQTTRDFELQNKRYSFDKQITGTGAFTYSSRSLPTVV